MNIYKIAKEKGYYINEKGEAFSKNKKLTLKFKNKIAKYYCFNIRDNENKVCRILVHRLQAYQKFGDEIFKEGIVVRHLDNNSLNNCIDNIAIGTQQENMLDRPVDELMFYAKNASSCSQKYNHEEIYNFYLQTKSYKLTMEKFNITSKGVIHYIIKKFNN